MKLTINLKENSYDVTIGKDILHLCKELFNLNRKVLIVTDDNIPSEYYQKIKEQAKDPMIVTVRNGEKSKSFETAEKILKIMLDNNFSRKDCVVAVGGGVVGDLAGFVAFLYMRGIDFYNVPTTVLSQVDSSIGGKVGINFEGVKNAIGAFHQPKGVLIDISTLNSLPPRQIKNGLIEALKSGAIRDDSLFELFENDYRDMDMQTVIYKSLKVKKTIVENDEKENGERKLLNFGHTLGHGIESVCDGKLYHGECVALGMYLISDGDIKSRLKNIYEKLGIWDRIYGVYTELLETKRQEMINAIIHDKKTVKDICSAVVVEKIGNGKISQIPTEKLVELLRR